MGIQRKLCQLWDPSATQQMPDGVLICKSGDTGGEAGCDQVAFYVENPPHPLKEQVDGSITHP